MSFCKVWGKKYIPGATPESFDYIIDGDYVYYLIYTGTAANPEYWGWKVVLEADEEKEVYGPLKDEIDGIPVIDIALLYKDCKHMKRPPVLPKHLKLMAKAFYGCEKLEYAPDIPKSVEDIVDAFYGCVLLEDLPHFDREAAFLKNLSYTSQAFCGCPHIVDDARRNPVIDVLGVDKEGRILSVAFVNGYELGYEITMRRSRCKTNLAAFFLLTKLELENEALLEKLKDGYGEIDEFTVSQIVMLNSCSVEALKMLTWEEIKRREAAGKWKW